MRSMVAGARKVGKCMNAAKDEARAAGQGIFCDMGIIPFS